MRAAAIIPARNEREGLERTLTALPMERLAQVVVVDNGSTDGTAEVARRFSVTVVSEPRRGYGRACLAGIARLAEAPEDERPEVVVFLDADGSDDPTELDTLIAPLRRSYADTTELPPPPRPPAEPAEASPPVGETEAGETEVGEPPDAPAPAKSDPKAAAPPPPEEGEPASATAPETEPGADAGDAPPSAGKADTRAMSAQSGEPLPALPVSAPDAFEPSAPLGPGPEGESAIGFDLVVGSRARGRMEPGAHPIHARWGNRLAAGLIRLFYGYRFTDLGPFRAIRWQTLMGLGMRDPDYGWTAEMQVKSARARVCAAEVPVSCRRRVGRSKISGTFGGSLLAGLKILLTVVAPPAAPKPAAPAPAGDDGADEEATEAA